ncbi:hypothetical protein [Candidatus Nitrospira bockiana]
MAVRVAVLVLVGWLSACVLTGEDRVIVEVDETGGNQAAKNLEAVRELLKMQREASPESGEREPKETAQPSLPAPPPEPQRPPAVSESPQSEPPEEPQSLQIQPRIEPPPKSEPPAKRAVPKRRKPSSPSVRPGDQSAAAGPVVPAYTIHAPVGSAYPGSIRCVPDAAGGQRCHATP